LKGNELEKYWDCVALEAKSEEILRVRKWRKAARNWLAEYADKRSRDFVLNTVEDVVGLKSPAKVLDVGCGPGKWIKLFARRYSAVTAIDISPKMIMLARESLNKEKIANVDFYIMDVSKLKLPSDTYDLVNCVTVLQHILDDEECKLAVKEMVRVARLGGAILLFETAPGFVIKRRTPHVRVRSMKHYITEFKKAKADLIYWRAVDLSLPITFFGLKGYAASFNRKVYYFLAEKMIPFFPEFFSLVSKMAALLAEPIDYKLGRTPLGLLSFGRIMLFKKNA